MSEFNPLNEARKDADVGRHIYDDFMNADTSHLSVQERAQGAKDFVDYLETTPYRDEKGNLHNPVTGEFISEGQAGEYYTYGENENANIAYEDMSVNELLKISAEAEVLGDKTKMIDVDDVILEKLTSRGYSTRTQNRDGSERGSSEEENVVDRALRLRQKYVDQLIKEGYGTAGSDDKKDTADDAEPSNPEYDGPVTPGMELELYQGDEKNSDGEEDHDPRRDDDTFGFIFNEETGEWEKQTIIPGFDTDPVTGRQIVESDPGMLERLSASGDRYAFETAKSRRSYLGRFLSSDSRVSRFLRRVPGISHAANFINNRTDQDVVQARNEYREMIDAVGADAAVKLREAGYNEEEIAHLSVLGRLEWDSRLEDGMSVIQQMRNAPALAELNTELDILNQRMREGASDEELAQMQEQYANIEGQIREALNSEYKQWGIQQHRQEQGRDANRFSNWWHRQKGIKGAVKKFGGVFAAGVAAGAFLPATAAGLVGLGITAGSLELARRMNQRRANSDSGIDGLSVAELHSRDDKAAKQRLVYDEVNSILNAARDDNGNIDLNVIADGLSHTNFASSIAITEGRTNEEMTANRRKFVAAAIAAITGYALGEVIDALTDSDLPDVGGDDDGGDGGGSEPTPEPEPTPQPEPTPEPEDPGLVIDPDELNPDEGAVLPEIAPIDTSEYEYPWNWASEQYGDENATAVLENLASRAAEDGHDVEWHGSGTGRWIEIDGISETSNAQGTGTLDILTQYAAEMNADLAKLGEAQPELPVTS